MKKHSGLFQWRGNDRGVAMLLATVALFVLIGFAALAIDVGHLYVVWNELKNAADAGALAGARVLYNNNGTSVNPGANQAAYDAATANQSEKTAVEVNWTGGNTGDVQRGHWTFDPTATDPFTPNSSLAPVDLWDVSTAELDANPNFINAVRVKTRRQATPAASFFARIFGFQDFSLTAVSVAYIGFSGSIEPHGADQPIAICRQAIVDASGNYTCYYGRMINSGSPGTASQNGHQTGGWTNFSQPCKTANANSVKPLVCASGNPAPINFGQGMGTTGGEVQTAFDDLISCWKNRPGLDSDGDGWPDRPWTLTLPVIDCPGNNTGNCSSVVGTVTLNIIWMTANDKNQYKEVPRYMEVPGKPIYRCPTGTPGQQCWNQFVSNFNLQDVLNGTPAPYENKTIYFLPDCTPHEPTGISGGQNYGVLAKIPVLVQ